MEDIGSFEFDDLSVSRTGRLVDENKGLELDRSGFLGCGSENVLGRSSDVHDQSRDGEDHLCEDTSSFEKELEEKKPYRHTTKENSDFFRGGKGARMFDKGI